MSLEIEQIKVAQAKIYKHLVDSGRVSDQIAKSQPVSDSMSTILTDIIRVAKDDTGPAEAAASSLRLFYLSHVEEGLVVKCAEPEDGWIAYSDHLCVINPFDKNLIDQATSWARNKDVKFKSIGVISNTYLAQLRAIHDSSSEVQGADFDEKLALQHVDDLIRIAAGMEASDIHFVPTQTEKIDLKFRIDGVLKTHKKIDLSIHQSMVRAVLEQRCGVTYASINSQDGNFEFALSSNKSINLRVNTIPVVRRSETSSKMVLRLLGNNTALADLKRLGLSEVNHNKMIRYGSFPYGMIIMTGPTGSGKTTTLYAELIDMQSKNPNRNIHTIEDPCEMQQSGMSHTEVTKNFTFAAALRAMLRQDPDVILVGEMRDQETAELSFTAAMTGHLILSTLHTNNSHESIGRLLDMGISMDHIVSNTTAILAQRLVRCLCEHCKVEYLLQDDAVRLRTYGSNKAFSSEKGVTRLFKASTKGCDYCGKTGLKGRHGVVEILELTPEIQVALLKGSNPSIMRLEQIKDGTFDDLWDDGLRLVANGIVAFEQLEEELKPYQMERVGMNGTLGSGQSVSVLIQHQQTSPVNQDNYNLATL